ncbi:Hypothetical protein FKW44_020013, partial [Caligus rogercresseyi]
CICKIHWDVQVAINDAARSIVGCKIRDHIYIGDLLERAGLPYLKEVAAKTVALDTWKCFYSNDGGGGARNPVVTFVFPNEVHHSSGVSTWEGDSYYFACHVIS